MIVLLLLVVLVALTAINVPIAIGLGIVAVGAMLITQGTATLPNLALVMYEGATNFPLLAIPLFIFAGAIMNASSISRRLIALCLALVGFIRGALAIVTVGVNMFYAEISGSAVADVAATGSILIPAMKKRGYPKAFAAAVCSSAATLAIIIPPSIPMIIYGAMANASIVQLFVAGIIPGVAGGFALMAMAWWIARRNGWPVEELFSWAKLGRAFRDAFWALFLPVIILGSIFGGFVTATEGAGTAVVAAFLIGTFVYRDVQWGELVKSAIEGASHTAVVMLLVASSALVGVFLTEQKVPQQMAQGILSITDNKYLVLAILNILFLILGMFLHSAAAIILVVPVVMPLVLAVGIDPVHFGLIVTINLGIGQQTPPVASVLMVACSIAKANVWEVTKVNLNFIYVLLVVLLIVTYVPIIPMSLVHLFYR
jgi:tripartite ATP-independent transporter DctM subunit